MTSNNRRSISTHASTDLVTLLVATCAVYLPLNLLAGLMPVMGGLKMERLAVSISTVGSSPVARGAAWGGGASPRPTATAGGGGGALPPPAAPVFGEMEYSLHTTPPFFLIRGGGVV